MPTCTHACNASRAHPFAEQPVSGADLERTYEALAAGMVLVVSLWSSEDLSWLDGGCSSNETRRAPYPKCDVTKAQVRQHARWTHIYVARCLMSYASVMPPS